MSRHFKLLRSLELIIELMLTVQEANKHSTITSQLFISNWGGSKDKKQLVENKIKTVICINEEHVKTSFDMKMYEEMGITHHYIKAADHRTSQLDLENLTDLMEKSLKDGPVLVHCTMGISRSVMVVLAYLLKVTYASPETPFDRRKKLLQTMIEFVKKRRPCINPNIGFLKQLRDYETKLRAHLHDT